MLDVTNENELHVESTLLLFCIADTCPVGSPSQVQLDFATRIDPSPPLDRSFRSWASMRRLKAIFKRPQFRIGLLCRTESDAELLVTSGVGANS
jgi:hypothetical protein